MKGWAVARPNDWSRIVTQNNSDNIMYTDRCGLMSIPTTLLIMLLLVIFEHRPDFSRVLGSTPVRQCLCLCVLKARVTVCCARCFVFSYSEFYFVFLSFHSHLPVHITLPLSNLYIEPNISQKINTLFIVLTIQPHLPAHICY